MTQKVRALKQQFVHYKKINKTKNKIKNIAIGKEALRSIVLSK